MLQPCVYLGKPVRAESRKTAAHLSSVQLGRRLCQKMRVQVCVRAHGEDRCMHVCAMVDARGRASSAAACGGNIAQRFKPRISVIHAEQSNGSTCTCSRPTLRLSRHPASQHRACVRVRVSARAHNSLTRARARTTHPCSARWPLPIPHRLAPRMPHATLVIMQPHLRAGVARADQKPCARHCGSAVEAAAASGGMRAGGRRCGCLPYAARTRQRGVRE